MTSSLPLQTSGNTLMIPFWNSSAIVSDAEPVQNWLHENKLQLNTNKCKEMIIDFKKQKHSFDRISIEGKALYIVSHAKILGMTVSNNLLWNDHINRI